MKTKTAFVRTKSGVELNTAESTIDVISTLYGSTK